MSGVARTISTPGWSGVERCVGLDLEPEGVAVEGQRLVLIVDGDEAV